MLLTTTSTNVFLELSHDTQLLTIVYLLPLTNVPVLILTSLTSQHTFIGCIVPFVGKYYKIITFYLHNFVLLLFYFKSSHSF